MKLRLKKCAISNLWLSAVAFALPLLGYGIGVVAHHLGIETPKLLDSTASGFMLYKVGLDAIRDELGPATLQRAQTITAYFAAASLMHVTLLVVVAARIGWSRRKLKTPHEHIEPTIGQYLLLVLVFAFSAYQLFYSAYVPMRTRLSFAVSTTDFRFLLYFAYLILFSCCVMVVVTKAVGLIRPNQKLD